MARIEQLRVAGLHTLLEGPHWDIPRQSLYYIDILEGKIFRYDYGENQVYEARLEGEPEVRLHGFIVPVAGTLDQFIVATGPRLVLASWDGKSPVVKKIRDYVEVDQEVKVSRFNDGKVDPAGRIFSGTLMSEDKGDLFTSRIGSFYRIVDGKATKLKSNIAIANGLAWNTDTRKFWYNDSGDYNLKEYDYDVATGEISNETIVLEIPKDTGGDTFLLDGMTRDEQGLLYIACFRGGRVIVFDPKQRKIVNQIFIPDATEITSVAFGGPNLDELFVTSAALNKLPAPNGGLFKVTGLGVRGTPMDNAKI